MCGVLYPGLRGLYSSICRSWARVSLEVECTSSDREVELMAPGDAELGGAEHVFEWLIRAWWEVSIVHIVCEG